MSLIIRNHSHSHLMNTMSHPAFRPTALTCAVLAFAASHVHAQTAAAPANAASSPAPVKMQTVEVRASADASAGGLKAPYAGGQVARGGRVGILGSQDMMDTPFAITSYTQKLIQDSQAQSIGDALQYDAGVRVARGFGNYQQVYFVRGLPVFSDDMSYNGLFGLLPRQYLAAELVERVEVLHGAGAFLNGASPGGSGLGGAVNVTPKRATNEPLNEVTLGVDSRGSSYVAADVARRFGVDHAFGIRVNAVNRDGDTPVDDSRRKLGLLSVGLDFHASNVRVSADLGYQDYQLRGAQPSVTFAPGVPILSAPDARRNFGQPWTQSNERDVFGTLRAEFDLTPDWTVWGAIGTRHGDESNDLANPTVTDAAGTLNFLRFTGTRTDRIVTGEVGVRGKLKTGDIGHTLVLSAATYRAKTDAPSQFADFGGVTAGTLYAPVAIAPAPMTSSFPSKSDTRTSSLALADTVSLLSDSLLVTLGARNQTFKDPISNYDESRVTPVGGVVYKVNKMVSVYGTYVEGLVKGDIAPATFGFPAQNVVNAGSTFKPYQTKQEEIGVKYDGGRFGGSFNIFRARKPVYAVNPTTLVFEQADDQTNRGAELSLFGEPMAGLRLLGGASYLNAKVGAGTRAIGTPTTQLNLGAEYDVPGVRGLSVNALGVHTSSQYADAANTQQVPAWSRLDLGARYTTSLADKDLTLRLAVTNVTNRNYWASAGGFPGAGYLVIGDPRMVTVSGTLSF
jgi:iron complex outermembrane receptor protein